jgi:hypothetical protein
MEPTMAITQKVSTETILESLAAPTVPSARPTGSPVVSWACSYGRTWPPGRSSRPGSYRRWMQNRFAKSPAYLYSLVTMAARGELELVGDKPHRYRIAG